MQKKRILILEDDTNFLELFKIIFEEKYNVSIASDGQTGIDLQRQHPHCLIITDMSMPKKSGLEVISEIKSEWPECKIIGMSGEEDKLEQAKGMGADLIFSKPFTPQTLLPIVNNMI